MDRAARTHTSRRSFLRGLVVAPLALAGCAGPLATIMYVAKDGKDVPAEFAGFQKKKVAVVCRLPPTLEYRSGSAAKELAERVGGLIATNGKKITVVDQQKVQRYIDENTWDDPREVGKAVEAEMLLAIDLEQFTLYDGQTLYRGKANVGMKVYDLTNNGSVVFEKFPPQIVYPPNVGVPTTDRQEHQFQREFILIVAEQIAQRFYAYDSRKNYAMDARAFQ